jgi:hypothetical protein
LPLQFPQLTQKQSFDWKLSGKSQVLMAGARFPKFAFGRRIPDSSFQSGSRQGFPSELASAAQ